MPQGILCDYLRCPQAASHYLNRVVSISTGHIDTWYSPRLISTWQTHWRCRNLSVTVVGWGQFYRTWIFQEKFQHLMVKKSKIPFNCLAVVCRICRAIWLCDLSKNDPDSLSCITLLLLQLLFRTMEFTREQIHWSGEWINLILLSPAYNRKFWKASPPPPPPPPPPAHTHTSLCSAAAV